jgi:predicted TIM-barrel fold metal-dependent hydrolase
LADTGSGHNVVKTVFVNCQTNYWTTGADHLRPVGETAFVARLAEEQAQMPGSKIAGIIGHADLTRGAEVEEALEAHEEAGGGLFRGIRHSLAHSEYPEVLMIPGRAPAGLSASKSFRSGVHRLGQLGYIFESWHFHYQIAEFTDLARALPETTIILNHLGTPLGVGPYESQRTEIFQRWSEAMKTLAECPNVFAKLGGLAMPDNGFGWHLADRPATSDEIVSAQAHYYNHTIDCFGPDRCMFESNFPVDRLSVSYRVLYNAFKKIAMQYSDQEQAQMFADTALGTYQI